MRQACQPRATGNGTNRAPAGTNRADPGTNPPWAGTNQRREVSLPPVLARPRHALWTGLRDSLGLIGPAQKHHWAEHRAMPCPA